MESLTHTEEKILELTAVGYAAKEIGGITGSATGTVRTHLKNIKLKRNLQKASELTAYYWCEYFGASFSDMRKRALEGAKQTVNVLVAIVLSAGLLLGSAGEDRRSTGIRARVRVSNISRRTREV